MRVHSLHMHMGKYYCGPCKDKKFSGTPTLQISTSEPCAGCGAVPKEKK